MKFLTLIVLIISLAATFIPCCEFDQCQNDEIESSTQQDNKEQKPACSPLSTCSHCSIATVIAKTIQLSKLEILINRLHEIETGSILPSYASSFWQPPRTELRSPLFVS